MPASFARPRGNGANCDRDALVSLPQAVTDSRWIELNT